MALVRKCDICGKIYDDIAIEETMNLYIDKNDPNDPDYESKSRDCCPECTRHVLRFISVIKDYGVNNYILNVFDDE